MTKRIETSGSSPDAEGLGNRKSGYGSAGLDTQSALASSVCQHSLTEQHEVASNSHRGQVFTDVEEPGRYAGSSPAPSELNSSGLLPEDFTSQVAETFPGLWSRYRAACAYELTNQGAHLPVQKEN